MARRHVLLLVCILALAAAVAAGTIGLGLGGHSSGGRVVNEGSVTVGTEPAPPKVPRPFGRLHCVAEHGVRFCAGNGTTERVPSFDGVPLDADVTLPAAGRGPFPLIVMLHGLGGSKTSFESASDDHAIDNVTFASMGYAVLTYTARGFGNSCGTPASRRGTPGCARGWIHLADQRYEVRDTQYLAGLLVDEGLVKPDIAVTGESYGGGQTLELAMLKNRVELPDGRLVPWVSPKHHVPMAVAAAYAMWGWDDLASALVPNGRLSATAYTPPRDDLVPAGVEKQSWVDLLYYVTTLGYLAPPGRDPAADLTRWNAAIGAGEPYGRRAVGYLRQLERYHSPIGIPMPPGGPPPLVMQNGWNDTLFPVSEALHFSERYAGAEVRPPLLQIFDDVGHGWSENRASDIAYQTRVAIRFLDDVMLAHRRPPTGVIAVGTTCPASAPSGPRLQRRSWHALTGGRPITYTSPPGAPAQLVTSSGGSAATAAALNPPNVVGKPFCQSIPDRAARGTASYTLAGPVPAATEVLGSLRVAATLAVKGDYPELVARLWDVDPSAGTRQIVQVGVFRPNVLQAPHTQASARATTTVAFELTPTFFTLARGHDLVLQLVGSTRPWFRASNGSYRIRVTKLNASIPTP